jgi:sugar/nucleoside kinase (ribokinase family)
MIVKHFLRRRVLMQLLRLFLAGGMAAAVYRGFHPSAIPLTSKFISNLERNQMNATGNRARPKWIAAVGSAVLDAALRGANPCGAGSKLICDSVELLIGGAASNFTRANRLVADLPPSLIAIMGPDDVLSRLTMSLLGAEFDDFRVVRASSASRIGVRIPKGADGETCVITNRPPLVDPDAVIDAIKDQLSRGDVGGLFLGSFTAADWKVVEKAVQLAHAHRVTVFLMLGTSQLSDHKGCIELLSMLDDTDWAQFNTPEMGSLAGTANPLDGGHWLREQGLRNRFLITEGDRGMYALASRDFYYQRAFAVESHCDVGAGDMAGGTLLAWLLSHNDADLATGLRLAAAAAAMHVHGGYTRKGGWAELEEFARVTPLRRFVPEPTRRPFPRRVALATTAAIGLVAAWLVS